MDVNNVSPESLTEEAFLTIFVRHALLEIPQITPTHFLYFPVPTIDAMGPGYYPAFYLSIGRTHVQDRVALLFINRAD